MRCPECEPKGLTHTVTLLRRFFDPEPMPPPIQEWDEQDRRHVHVLGEVVSVYRCSAGHNWQVHHWEPCPTCGSEWTRKAD